LSSAIGTVSDVIHFFDDKKAMFTKSHFLS